jgi:hypothetical protein
VTRLNACSVCFLAPVRARSCSGYNFDVSVDLEALPVSLADAVIAARARLRRVDHERGSFELRTPDPVIGEWVRESIDSGELAAALRDVAAGDPDLRL